MCTSTKPHALVFDPFRSSKSSVSTFKSTPKYAQVQRELCLWLEGVVENTRRRPNGLRAPGGGNNPICRTGLIHFHQQLVTGSPPSSTVQHRRGSIDNSSVRLQAKRPGMGFGWLTSKVRTVVLTTLGVAVVIHDTGRFTRNTLIPRGFRMSIRPGDS